MAIPVIDFSKLSGDERSKTLAQIAICCEEWGFFQLINHGISEDLLERVKKVASECYKFERQPGFENSKPVNLLKELVEKKSEESLVESIDWEDVFLLTEENHDEWPSKTPGFKETMREYRAELKKLAIKVMEVMDENLGLPKGYINKAFSGGGEKEEEDSAFFGTKVSHYPPCPRPDKVNGLRAHTDAGGVILLFQDDEVSGLQILKDGVWIDVQPIKNAIVINTGDQIEVLSNGKYKSVWHRVLALPEGNRRSIASFYNPSFKAIIEPAKELVPEEKKIQVENLVKYPKFVFGDYMSVYAEQKFLPKEPRFQAVKAV
ncbi:1-aminocyclopropane-1-carboxylate oxidase 5-like [Dorcoceras hygrometricum]|uniref:aminocyclopropanecarboxylate oxidase n=1 Tax=Dorcoceras hygrometricum TaxID=472368 RepID=A0A2Z7CKJ9_9LAMI|nr:1-aminocyclopropane-1-carboxylate oxidase 5-like [Dorcoceras hygrometricum]